MFDMEKVSLKCDMTYVGGEVHSVCVDASRAPEGPALLSVVIDHPAHKCCRDCAVHLAEMALDHLVQSEPEVC